MSLRQSFFLHIGQTSPEPQAFEVDRAEGIYLFDIHGKRYADMISGIGVSSLGHGNPLVVEAVQAQAERYMHTMVYGEHIQHPQVAFASLLCEHLPESIQNVFFTNSGSEAVEAAIKLARKFTGRYEIIACRNAYHGSTHGSQSLMSNTYYSAGFRPFVPGVRFIDYDDPGSLDMINDQSAAVFVETIQGEAGIRVASSRFMEALREKCDQTGALLVMDEIQCGFGRTGKLFAFEHYGIIPDILLMAKAMGAGMPIGALAGHQNILRCLSHDPVLGYINTFGGHPVSAAAGLAGLQFLLEHNIMQEVEEKAALFASRLSHPAIRDIRFKGLMMAFDLGSKSKMKKMVSFAYENQILMDWFLYDEHSFRIAPPLIITMEQIMELTAVLRKGLDLL